MNRHLAHLNRLNHPLQKLIWSGLSLSCGWFLLRIKLVSTEVVPPFPSLFSKLCVQKRKCHLWVINNDCLLFSVLVTSWFHFHQNVVVHLWPGYFNILRPDKLWFFTNGLKYKSVKGYRKIIKNSSFIIYLHHIVMYIVLVILLQVFKAIFFHIKIRLIKFRKCPKSYS